MLHPPQPHRAEVELSQRSSEPASRGRLLGPPQLQQRCQEQRQQQARPQGSEQHRGGVGGGCSKNGQLHLRQAALLWLDRSPGPAMRYKELVRTHLNCCMGGGAAGAAAIAAPPLFQPCSPRAACLCLCLPASITRMCLRALYCCLVLLVWGAARGLAQQDQAPVQTLPAFSRIQAGAADTV